MEPFLACGWGFDTLESSPFSPQGVGPALGRSAWMPPFTKVGWIRREHAPLLETDLFAAFSNIGSRREDQHQEADAGSSRLDTAVRSMIRSMMRTMLFAVRPMRRSMGAPTP